MKINWEYNVQSVTYKTSWS